MKLPFLLLSLSAPLLAQGLPGNVEMSLHADTLGTWVLNSEGQITRIKDSGAKEGDYRTWTPGAKTVNPQADYPVWKGASHRGRTLFPVATATRSGKGLFRGFWAFDKEPFQILETAIRDTAYSPVPDRWLATGDTLLGTSDSSAVLWRLDGNDSLTALGLASNGTLVTVARCGACWLADSLKAHAKDTLQVLQGIDRAGDTLLLASTKGLWKGGQILSRLDHPSLGRGNVLGVWAGAGGVYAQTDSTLWYLPSIDSTPRRIRGDSALVVDHRISALTWSGDTAWVLLRTASFGLSGLVRLHRGSVVSLGGGKTPTLLDAEDGLPFSAEVNLSDLVRSPATATSPARLWVGSRGEGLAWTTPGSGRWNLLRRQAPLASGLKDVRVIPTRLEGGSSLIAYSLSAPGNVTIEVFNGAMEPVRTVVRGAARPAGLRSELVATDRWDGCTDGGRLAAIGLYYVRVKSGSQTGWGKVFQLKGGSACGQ